MSEDIRYCPDCQVGVFKMEGATYYTWIADELVMVQDFPCWVCDVCGNRIWDSHALMNLNLILSPDAGETSLKHIAIKQKSSGIRHSSVRARNK